MPNEWDEKLERGEKPRMAGKAGMQSLDSESLIYSDIKCSTCPYRSSCTLADNSDKMGCRQRKYIHDSYFKKIEFKSETDPITANRLRLASHYYVELLLKRSFGDQLKSEEVMLLKTTLSEFDKLFFDKKGELLDSKSKPTTAWEADPEVEKLKREVAEARAMRSEYDRLKKKNTIDEEKGEKVS